MEQSKYFTPKNDEIYLGYECEQISVDFEWFKVKAHTIPNQHGYIIDLYERALRCKYLDTDDIISLGWVKTELEGYFVRENEKGLYKLEQIGTWLDINLILKQKHPQFDIHYPGEFHESSDRGLFSGECKSINELQIIHKLLKIN